MGRRILRIEEGFILHLVEWPMIGNKFKHMAEEDSVSQKLWPLKIHLALRSQKSCCCFLWQATNTAIVVNPLLLCLITIQSWIFCRKTFLQPQPSENEMTINICSTTCFKSCMYIYTHWVEIMRLLLVLLLLKANKEELCQNMLLYFINYCKRQRSWQIMKHQQNNYNSSAVANQDNLN